MFASTFGWTSGVFQESGGSSAWVWVIIIIVLIVLVLWWLGRQERGPIEGTGTRKIETETKSSGGLPAVEDVSRASVGATAYSSADLEQAPVIIAGGETVPQVSVPDAIVPDVVQPDLTTYDPNASDVRDNVDVPILRHESGPAIEPFLGKENPVELAQESMTPLKPDDLEIIEGIGPKIAGLLRAAEIGTFSKLAEIPVSRLQEMMRDANLRIADPTTWPEQAQLAAEGRWDELKEYQSRLRGGRVV